MPTQTILVAGDTTLDAIIEALGDLLPEEDRRTDEAVLFDALARVHGLSVLWLEDSQRVRGESHPVLVS